jgi:hypothetical protein
LLRAGIGISAAGDQIPGKLKIQQPFIVQSPYTGATAFAGGKLGCIQSAGQFFVSDCGTVAATQTYIGVNQASVGSSGSTTGAPVQTEGGPYVLSNAMVTNFVQGDVVCTDPNNAADVVDNGTNSCPYPTVQVGFAWLSDSPNQPTTSHPVLLARGYNAQAYYPFPTICGGSNTVVPCSYSITGLTAAQGRTTLLAADVATGMRRMCAYGYISTAATSGSISIRAYYNNGTSVGPKQLGQSIDVSGAGNDSIPAASPAPSECVIFYHVTGNAIQYDTSFNSVSGTPTYASYITVE